MATEEGVVFKMGAPGAGTAWVKTTRSSACEACSSRNACHAEAGANEMEVEAINTVAGDASALINPDATEIVAFENSRLEVTSMAQPEEITFLSDFQRTIVSETIISPTVETLSREDVEIMMRGIHRTLSGPMAATGTKESSVKKVNAEARRVP